MPLPTLEKTWQYAHVSNTPSGDVVTDLNHLFLSMKDAAKAFGSSPATCVGCSNGVTYNMSGTDLFTSTMAFVRDYAGNHHSWYVLGLPGVGAGAQVCWDYNHKDGAKATCDVIVTWSGFTGGSVTNRPTATDELVLINGDEWTGRLGAGDDFGGQATIHLMGSTDGACFRMLVANNGVVGSFLMVEKAGGPVPGWTNPMIVVFRTLGGFNNTNDNILTWDSWYNQRVFSAIGPVSTMPLFPTLEMRTGVPIPTQLDAPNEISGEYPLCRVGLYHYDTVGQRGRHGHVVDFWFTCPALLTGDTFPGDGSKQFVVFSDAVFPGDGTVWSTS